MKIDNCIFCNKPLDNSDEHIIPDCLNGRLRSTKLICKTCNIEKFGRELDPIIKQLFNTTLLALGLKNANSIQIEDPDRIRFLYSKTGKVSRIKPELTEIKKDGKTYICVSGDKKNAVKYFAKQAAELLKKEYKSLKFDIKEVNDSAPPLSIECKFEITKEIILELNKIAIEFYAYSGLELLNIKHISERVNVLDANLNNVIFCNWAGEVRTIVQQEISHLIVLRTNKNGTLYCYIELFNIICAYIKLYNNSDKQINFVYHQDAITGERLTEDVQLNLETEPPNRNDTESFDILRNAMFYRQHERYFSSISKEIFTEIEDKTNKEVKNGALAEKNTETYIKRCCEAIAQLSIHSFPYMIEDFKDEENQELNYIHSNLQDNQFNKFCELNQHIIGIKVDFPNEGEYLFDSFYKQPFLNRNGITLVKVYCVLIHSETKQKKHIPYRSFFEGIIPNSKTENDNKPETIE